VLRTEPRELSEVEDMGAAERAELSAERRALFEQLGALAEEDRDLLIMREFERLSWEAIGEVLDCSIEKARRDHALAFQRLQRRLGG